MKKILCLFLLVALMLSGCTLEELEAIIPSGDFGHAVGGTTPNLSTDPSKKPATEPDVSEPATEPSIQEPETAEIDNLVHLRDYMHENIEAGNLEFSFVYTGEEYLPAQLIAQMTSAAYIEFLLEDDVYNITVTQYPGDRIVDAYLSGDTSRLDDTELEAMDMALDMVEQAKLQAADNWELELLIHDMLADHITYYDGNRDYTDPDDIPRNLTVVGALLDGKANCQGYTDAFYTLASMAGFEVYRMNVETPDDFHIVNTICLDGQWYVVDVTYDDQEDTGYTSHRLFNAGTDIIGEYTWPEEKEIHPIVTQSDSYQYYNHEGIVYNTLDEMVDAVANQWAVKGENIIRARLRNETDGMKLNDVLYDALIDTGKAFSYTFWYITNGTDTFYTVVFED